MGNWRKSITFVLLCILSFTIYPSSTLAEELSVTMVLPIIINNYPPPPPLPPPTDLVASAYSPSQINLSWKDNSTDETSFLIERSPDGTSDWLWISSVQSNTTSYTNHNLSCDTQYFYRVRAWRDMVWSYSDYSNIANAITGDCFPHNTGNVQIALIFYNDSYEFVDIVNNETFPIQLSNWTLQDIDNHIFTFPDYVIEAHAWCRVFTNVDTPDWCGFNYNSETPIWDNTGDCGYLHDSTDTLISEYCY